MNGKRFKFNGRNNCIEYDGKSILLDSYGEDIEELLNKLYEENQELRLLVDTLKEQNMKFKLRLEDLGVEYL